MSNRLKLRRSDGRTYLTRRGVEGPWGGVLLHTIEAPDPGVDLHDHPWEFSSIVLWGGYTEQRELVSEAVTSAQIAEAGGGEHERGFYNKRRWLSWRKMNKWECHRITDVPRKTYTLVFHGPKRDDRPEGEKWGFYTPDGYIEHHTYARTDYGMRRGLWNDLTQESV